MINITEWRPGDGLPDALLSRITLQNATIADAVRDIVDAVRTRGDAAVCAYTKEFDRYALTPEKIKVTSAEIDAAVNEVGPELIGHLEAAARNIRAFHEMQMQRTWLDMKDGITLGQMVTPVDSVGLYAPGGLAAYPSSLLMAAIPAKVAGGKRIALATPPSADGTVKAVTLAAARVAGIDEIYRIGGAQAIAALAFGTETVKPVCKIAGPGNAFVAAAKREVFGIVGIDSIAGPSEVLVVADETARADWVAADLIAQAEHGPLGAAVLVTTCRELAEDVKAALKEQLKTLPTRRDAEETLRAYGLILLVKSIEEAMEFSNIFAPEHLELCVNAPMELLPQVRNAGAVFLGHYTPEPVGDYWAGPSHILPTLGTARFSSPVTVDDFTKKTSIIGYSRAALAASASSIAALAESEKLYGHARSTTIRNA